jgi:hypothetical protein
MNRDEITDFIGLNHFKFITTVQLKQLFAKHPIFLFIDGTEQPCAAHYNPSNKSISFAKLNPMHAIIYCISRKLNIDFFSDALKNDLVEAINTVLKNYNINVEELNGSNVQDKISGDESPKS